MPKTRRTDFAPTRWTVITVSVAVIVALVVLSPLALTLVARLSGRWADLGNVGQAYGGVSAVLSAIALCGIVVSLALQRRQTRMATLAPLRQRHFDLVKLSIEHPELQWFDPDFRTPHPNTAGTMFINLWVSHWRVVWEFGEIGDDTVREVSAQLFRSSIARDWWRTYGPSYANQGGHIGPRFHALVNEAYRKAIREPADRPEPPAPATPAATPKVDLLTTAVVAGALGMAVGAGLAGWRRAHRR